MVFEKCSGDFNLLSLFFIMGSFYVGGEGHQRRQEENGEGIPYSVAI